MMRAVLLAITLVIVGCGGDDGALPGEPIGATCETNIDCQTGVCWDFHDHDMLCAGKVCSTTCTTDAECVDAASRHGAFGPSNGQLARRQQPDLELRLVGQHRHRDGR